jgi:hypothetical protein
MTRAHLLFVPLLAAGALAACATAATGAVGAAAINTALAGGAAAYEVSKGRCPAACPVGTACDARTQLCEPLPCHGRCQSNERCETSGLLERCVPAAVPDLRIETTGGAQKKTETPAATSTPPAAPMPAPEAPRVTPQ